MAANLLRVMGLDPEKLTAEFQTRVQAFEQGIAALNSALIQINTRLDAIEATQREIIFLLKGNTASVGKPNGTAITDQRTGGVEQ